MNIIEQYPGENSISIAEDVLRNYAGNVVIKGRNNNVTILRPFSCSDVYVELNGNGTVNIGEGCLLSGQHIRLFSPGRITIGDRCAFNGSSFLHMHESAVIQLGKNCLIASGTSFSSSHVHKIIDLKSGERLNPAGDVIVGDHVWISADATLWPGANVGHDSVVGRGSYVSRTFPPNCIVAGTPARVVREGITWEG